MNKKSAPAASAADILSYRHPDRRKNNPEVGMVTPPTDPDEGKAVRQDILARHAGA